MASVKPYLTSDTLVESVKRRISFPLSQNTFTYNDIISFAQEEMQISAVPAVKEEHEEYFVYKVIVPLVAGISRYAIPDRAIGMALRDLTWSDTNGNFFDMTRIAPDDKAFYQQNVGSNASISKYYLEGNEVVLTPQNSSGVTGSLNFFIFLRPNFLVRDDRAAIIEEFQKSITIASNASIVAGDTIVITTGNQTPSPVINTFTAVSSSPGDNEFLIDATATLTAANLNTAINAAAIEGVTSTSALSVVTVSYEDITTSYTIENDTAFTVDNDNIYILFDNLASTYTDPDTDETSDLYEAGGYVDFLQTKPGHRTYTYSVKLRSIPSSNVGKFLLTDLQSYLNNSSGGTLEFWPIIVGDYICVENECIIPQIPPELHSALAERTAGRVLMAIGDQQGYSISQQRVAEMDQNQATLIGSRVEGSVNRVFNAYSLLRLNKRRARGNV